MTNTTAPPTPKTPGCCHTFRVEFQRTGMYDTCLALLFICAQVPRQVALGVGEVSCCRPAVLLVAIIEHCYCRIRFKFIHSSFHNRGRSAIEAEGPSLTPGVHTYVQTEMTHFLDPKAVRRVVSLPSASNPHYYKNGSNEDFSIRVYNGHISSY